jgi:hypothetical protein
MVTSMEDFGSIHKTNRVSTHTLENDRCKSGLNIYFTTKCAQLGATGCYHSSEQNTADLTSLEYCGQQDETKLSTALK